MTTKRKPKKGFVGIKTERRGGPRAGAGRPHGDPDRRLIVDKVARLYADQVTEIESMPDVPTYSGSFSAKLRIVVDKGLEKTKQEGGGE